MKKLLALVVVATLLAIGGCRTAGLEPEAAGSAADAETLPYGFPGAAYAARVQERLPLDRTVDTRALYRLAERRVARMPRYSSARGLRLGPGSSAPTELVDAWEPIGPLGNPAGRLRTFVISPADGTMYAGGVSGGVWKRRPNADRWIPVGDDLQNLAVNSMAMHPDDPDRIVIGTGEGYFREDVRGTGLPLRGGGIFRTDDGARSWSFLEETEGEDFWFVNDLVYSADGGRLYAATRAGVFRSTDDGDSWIHILETDLQGGCLDLAIRTDRPRRDTLFAACGTFEQAQVLRTNNAARDTRRGPRWRVVLEDPGMGRTTLAIAPSNQRVIYALSASIEPGRFEGALHAVLRSRRGGNPGSWHARVRNTDPMLNNRVLLENAITVRPETCGFGANLDPIPMGWYVNSLAVDPADPNIVWAAGVDWFRSDNGGADWGRASFGGINSLDSSNIHVDHHGLVFDPAYDGMINQTAYALTDGGIWRTDNARAAVTATPEGLCDPAASDVGFDHFNDGLGITQFYHGSVAPNGAFVIAGAQDNGTLETDPDSTVHSWFSRFGGDGSYSAIDYDNPDTRYYQAQFSILVRHDNGREGGVTSLARTFLPEPDQTALGPGTNFLFISPLAMFPPSPERRSESLLLGGRRLYLSEDGARSWRRVGRRLPQKGLISAIAAAPGNGEKVLIGGNLGHLWFTDRVGSMGPFVRWPNRRRPRKAWVTSVAFDPTVTVEDPGEQVLYATYGGFGGEHVFRSENGRRWRSIDGDLPDIPVHSLVVDPGDSDRIFIGTDLGVFVTTDGGDSWAREIAGFGNIVTEWLVLQEEEEGRLMLYAFTHGRGAWRVEVSR